MLFLSCQHLFKNPQCPSVSHAHRVSSAHLFDLGHTASDRATELDAVESTLVPLPFPLQYPSPTSNCQHLCLFARKLTLKQPSYPAMLTSSRKPISIAGTCSTLPPDLASFSSV